MKISIEVSSGATRFEVTVRAESIERAVGLVAERYPKRDARVKFPIGPEDFFVEDPAVRTGIVEVEQPAAIAA